MPGSRRAVAALAASVALWGAAHVALSAAPAQPAVAATVAPAAAVALTEQYCVTCHSQRRKAGGVVLEGLHPERLGEDRVLWEKVARKLATREMPPAGLPRPDAAQYRGARRDLETALDQFARQHPEPDAPIVHRLNRTEYGNAVRDILGVDLSTVPGGRGLLPADDTGYGFDNIADVLSVSPTLMERYLAAARRISHLVVGSTATTPGSVTYPVSKLTRQEERMDDALPFASRGGLVARHYFPQDAEYTIRIGLVRTYLDEIRGLAQPHRLEVRVNGALVKVFVTGGPVDESGQPRSAEQRRQDLKRADERLEARVQLKAGPADIGVSYVNERALAEGALRPDMGVASWEYASDIAAPPAVASVTIRGPFGASGATRTGTRRGVFVCVPARVSEEGACATRIVQHLARRAYRRPVSAEETARLRRTFDNGRRDGTFEEGIRLVVERILVSPEFLFRAERAPRTVTPGGTYRLPDLELASNLSFFLWSSVPDDALIDLAVAGRLRQPVVLRAQVARLLADPRASALVDNFASQWLQTRNVALTTKDPIQFPEYDENLRLAFEQETRLFLDSQIRGNRPIPELLSADYTFVNERLAKFYRVPNVFGSHFRRVSLQERPERRGLLGQGAVLLVTSHSARTAPTIRGKWILDTLLGSPPPPPPANVPSLTENTVGSVAQTVRERLETHRKNPACAGCHARMDPLGFSLESFDAIGRWRDTEHGVPIDTAGHLPDGTKFSGPAGLYAALAGRQEELIQTVAERVMTYALGRGVDYRHQPAIRDVLRRVSAGGNRWSTLITEIVLSAPFQQRRAATSVE